MRSAVERRAMHATASMQSCPRCAIAATASIAAAAACTNAAHDARGASALMSMRPDQAFEMADGTAVSDCATPCGLSADCFTETTGTGNRCALTTTCRLQCFQSDSVLIAHVSYFGVRQWKLRLRCVQCIARA